MSITQRGIAVAAVLGALSFPVLAAGDDPNAKRNCSICGDPTWPEVTNPAPAIALHGSGRAEAEALNADPTWPRTETVAPGARLSLASEAVAGGIVNDEPMASAVREPAAPRMAAK